MPWKIQYAKRFEKEILGLKEKDQEAVREGINRLITDIAHADIRIVQGKKDQWRVRVGRWRIRIRLENATGTIYILNVRPRDKAYKD